MKTKHIPKEGVLWTTLLYGIGPGYDWGNRSNKTMEQLGEHHIVILCLDYNKLSLYIVVITVGVKEGGGSLLEKKRKGSSVPGHYFFFQGLPQDRRHVYQNTYKLYK